MAAKIRVEVAKQKEACQAKKRQARSTALVEHLEALAKAQRKRKAGPSALDPIRDVPNPMQETKGKVKHKKNKLVRLLHLSALAVMSQPVDTQLASWTTGAAVDCGPEWARKAVDIAVARGSHPTAIAPEATALVHEDIDYQVKAGFTEIVYWDEIKDALPKHFKVSPVAVIPQTGWTPRQDHTRSVISSSKTPMTKGQKRRMGEVIQDSVNATSQRLAPIEPVKEIGNVLPRPFHFMASTPEDQEIRLSKVDLSDGFWRLLVEPEQKWNFCYVMPDPPGARTRIVVPSALQMDWAESSAYFCAALPRRAKT